MCAPGKVDVGTAVDEELGDMFRTTGGGSMECRNAIPNGIDWLLLAEGILNEPDVARQGGLVETQIGI
jgi:hypothetical protein